LSVVRLVRLICRAVLTDPAAIFSLHAAQRLSA
jgi:hypothetical protein